MDLRDVFDAAAIMDLDDGMFRRDLENKLAAIMRDIAGRPANSEGKAERRKLTIEIEFTPVSRFDAGLNERVLQKIETKPRVHTSLPKTRGATTELRLVKQNGQLVPYWNRDSPHDVDQITPPLPGMSREELNGST